jgi:hypothetical protein
VNKIGQGFVDEKCLSRQSVRPMNATTTQYFHGQFSHARSGSEMERFRDKFQRSLKSCVKKGFSVEESFGMIWVETWEEVAVTEEEQSQLFDELIGWAKKVVK